MNTVFMIKIKIRTEIKVVYVGAPNQIYGEHEESATIFSNTQSIRDNVYVEFYDVLEEENFDPKKDQPIQNLRLIDCKKVMIRDLPFDDNNVVEEFTVKM